MGERYLVTGTQLGMLQAVDNKLERKEIIDDILRKQFIATSGCDIETDVHNINKLL